MAKRSLVAELVGPAGAGKTTLLRALCQRNKQIVPGIRFNKTRYFPLFISEIAYWLPYFLCRYSRSRWFTWGELRSMTYLAGGQEAIKRRAAMDDAVTLLDHGPIFRLALLHEFGPPMTKDRHYAQWWGRMLAQWANTLSLVVWLDASDGVLLQRIHTRDRAHRIKGKSEHDVREFLVRYRSAYRDIIEKLAGLQGPALLSFNTEKQSPDQIVEEVLVAFEAERKN